MPSFTGEIYTCSRNLSLIKKRINRYFYISPFFLLVALIIVFFLDLFIFVSGAFSRRFYGLFQTCYIFSELSCGGTLAISCSLLHLKDHNVFFYITASVPHWVLWIKKKCEYKMNVRRIRPNMVNIHFLGALWPGRILFMGCRQVYGYLYLLINCRVLQCWGDVREEKEKETYTWICG